MAAVELAQDVFGDWSDNKAAPNSAAPNSEWLAVSPILRDLLPQGLRRGTTVAVSSPSLLFTLIATPTQNGSWVGIAGMSTLGIVAATELGVCLERCAFVPKLGRNWPTTIASLINAVDVVVFHVSQNVTTVDARRLVARARQQRSVLVLCNTRWPEQPSVELHVAHCRWSGIDWNDIDGQNGHLTGREIEIVASGRGTLAQHRRMTVWFGQERRAPNSPLLRAVSGGES